MPLRDFQIKELPKTLPLRKLLGPSFIILGLGLGSGEIILWPYLTSNFGLGILWGAVLGITFQFFMNMEIERYALANGESVFVGFARKLKWLPIWFLISTFLPWIWPGIAASSSRIFSELFGISNPQHSNYLTVGFLILMGLILSLGPILYKTVENLQKTLILIGVPSFFTLAIMLAKPVDFVELAQGIVGIGNNYFLLPAGISLTSFLAALAYAGAGGNLNLAQSFYIKEKGYGMGKYAGRITSLLTGKAENISITGSKFEETPENISEFKKWWKNVNTEHFVVFWLTGALTILFLGLLAYTTTYGMPSNKNDITFVINEATAIGQRTIPILGSFFLLITGLALFGTQLTVFDATSRILSENLVLTKPNNLNEKSMRKFYYGVLWAQIITASLVVLFGISQPKQLLIISAVLNAFAMFIHSGLTLWLNHTLLHKSVRPNVFRTSVMILAFVFYGGFSIYTFIIEIQKFLA